MDKTAIPQLVSVVACRKQWEDLRPLADSNDRWRDSCAQRVYQVKDREGAEAAIAAHRCIYANDGKDGGLWSAERRSI